MSNKDQKKRQDKINKPKLTQKEKKNKKKEKEKTKNVSIFTE